MAASARSRPPLAAVADTEAETTIRLKRLVEKMMFESACATHVGLVRSINEDAVLARPEIGLWAVADGVGGADAGDRASAAIVAALSELPQSASGIDPVEWTRHALHQVNAQLRHEALARASRRGIASTVICLLIRDRRFFCLWVGDSRLYRLRGDRLEQISHDHSEVQSLLDFGLITEDEAKFHPLANTITRAVGAYPDIDLDCIAGEVETGDAFLLCSDGLTRVVDSAAIASVLAEATPAEAVERLIGLTLEGGAPDNVSVVVVRIASEMG
jgi:serine/threonine-protein phosphatase Stp1